MSPNLAARLRHDSLDNSQAQTYPFAVLRGSSLQLTELLEQLIHVACSYSIASVLDVNDQKLLPVVVARQHCDFACACELLRIFDQIDQHLFKASLIADQNRRQLLR